MTGKPPNQGNEPPRTPDQASAIWAPWRLTYLESLDEDDERAPEKPASGPPQGGASFLADYWADPSSDIQNHVLVRTGDGMILLNGYPYANGHLLVALGEARPRLLDYDPTQRAAFWGLVDRAMDLMERTLRPQGVNVGVNQGRAAGAGIPQHLHAHLVPRWGGDVNFISTVAGIRVIPSSLDAMAERYRAVVSKDAGG